MVEDVELARPFVCAPRGGGLAVSQEANYIEESERVGSLTRAFSTTEALVPEADPNHMVHCIKLQKDLPGLTRAPFPGEFGQFLYENVSKEAWDQWLRESARYINTYQLDLSTREGTEFMLKQLRVWLGLEEGELAATSWRPPSAES